MLSLKQFYPVLSTSEESAERGDRSSETWHCVATKRYGTWKCVYMCNYYVYIYIYYSRHIIHIHNYR